MSSLLHIVTTLQGFAFLIVTPAIVMHNLLAMMWKPLVICMLTNHVGILCLFWISSVSAGKQIKRDLVQALVSLSLNPIATIRASDRQMLIFALVHPAPELSTIDGR
jgi:formate/nitrite transporter FocA (FNT family)